MDIKEILKKIAEGKTLTDSERDFAGTYEPEQTDRIPKSRLDAEIAKKKDAEKKADDLQSKLDELTDKVDELESKGLSNADKLKKEHDKEIARLNKQIADLTHDRDQANAQLAARDLTATVSKIAGNYKFDNPEYLEYLISKKGIDLKDEIAVKNFMKELETAVPTHFQSDAKSGSGSKPDQDAGNESAVAEKRIKELLAKPELSQRELGELAKLAGEDKSEPAQTTASGYNADAAKTQGV